jgi:polar amino acid transport system permease protein
VTTSSAADRRQVTAGGQPELIKAVPLRRPGRWIAAVIVLLLLVLFIYGAATNSAYDWHAVGKYLFDTRVEQAAMITLLLTALAMTGAIVLGVLLAVMRLSPNPVLKSVAWLYVWFFRGTPIYVQLVFWGLMSTIYKRLDLGIPFVHQFAHIKTNTFFSYFWLAVIGLALNEAAYMAEIVRAGIGSVDEGQTEAATALGMSWSQTMMRIVLPQAMRVIIPPTGNELISMLKTTSLVTAVPYSYELYSRTRDLSIETFNPIPMLIVASAWYLLFTSILMIGQFYLERYFARGASRKMSARQLQALAQAQGLGVARAPAEEHL